MVLRTSAASAPAPTVAAPTVPAPTFAAARSRAHGPTAALWHAVELHRPTNEVDGACELTLCGTLARVTIGEQWPTPARDVCVPCTVLAGGAVR